MLPQSFPTRLLLYLAADLFGMFCVVLGALWLINGRPTLLPHTPNSLAEAAALLTGGFAVVLWAAARLLREARRARSRH